MSKKPKIMAIPFSTNEYIQFKEFAEQNLESVDLEINTRLSVGSLLDEIIRPRIKAYTGEGIMIIDHSKKSSDEIFCAIEVLEGFDKKFFSMTNGLEPITKQSLSKVN